MLSLAYRRKVFRLEDYSGIFPQPILLKSAFEACDLPHNGPYQGHFLKLKNQCSVRRCQIADTYLT
jgi:hypothetical protein